MQYIFYMQFKNDVRENSPLLLSHQNNKIFVIMEYFGCDFHTLWRVSDFLFWVVTYPNGYVLYHYLPNFQSLGHIVSKYIIFSLKSN